MRGEGGMKGSAGWPRPTRGEGKARGVGWASKAKEGGEQDFFSYFQTNFQMLL